MLTFAPGIRRYVYNSSWLYTIRILIALSGATAVPWWLGQPTSTIPVTLGVVAAALTDLDDRLTGRLRNLFITLACFLSLPFRSNCFFPIPGCSALVWRCRPVVLFCSAHWGSAMRLLHSAHC